MPENKTDSNKPESLEIMHLSVSCDHITCTYCKKPFTSAIIIYTGQLNPDRICNVCVSWAYFVMGGNRDA